MGKLVRPLAVIVLACLAPSTHALNATIKREVPLLLPGVHLRNTPIQAVVNIESVAYDGLQFWVAARNNPTSTVQRFDAVSNALKGTITYTAPAEPRKVVFDGTYVWVFTLNERKAYKYNASGALQSGFPITLTGDPEGAAFDGNYIWVSTSAGTGTLSRIDVSTRAITNFPVNNNGAVAFDGKDLWIIREGAGTTKVSGTTGAVLFSSPSLGGWGTNSVAFDGQYIWSVNVLVDTVSKIDVTTNQVVATVSAYPGAGSLAFDGALMWVVCRDSNTIVKIDTRTNQIVGTVQLPAGTNPYDIAFDGTHMWVSGMGTGLVHKILAHF
jgi:YVTN family beta-propeller protein